MIKKRKEYSNVKVRIETNKKIIALAKREKRSKLAILELAVNLYEDSKK